MFDVFKKVLKFDNIANDSDKAVSKAKKALAKGKQIELNQPLSERENLMEEVPGVEQVSTHANSTCIANAKYDPKTRDLVIQFQSGPKEYTYPDVPENEVEGLLDAGSKGKFYHSNLKQYSTNYRAPDLEE